ncbi:uncharacterized protein MONBRDRAFT_31741, partial [Monosiga brevicollis MX1]
MASGVMEGATADEERGQMDRVLNVEAEDPDDDQVEEQAEDQDDDQVEEQAEDQDDDQVEEQAEDQDDDQVEEQAEDQDDDQVEEQAEDPDDDQVEEQAEDPDDDQVEEQAEDQDDDQVEEQTSTDDDIQPNAPLGQPSSSDEAATAADAEAVSAAPSTAAPAQAEHIDEPQAEPRLVTPGSEPALKSSTGNVAKQPARDNILDTEQIGSSSQPDPEAVREVFLPTPGKPSGVQLVGPRLQRLVDEEEQGKEAEASGIFVSGLKPDSTLSSELGVGDRVLAMIIDGRPFDTLDATLEDVINLFRLAQQEVKLHVRFEPKNYEALHAFMAATAENQIQRLPKSDRMRLVDQGTNTTTADMIVQRYANQVVMDPDHERESLRTALLHWHNQEYEAARDACLDAMKTVLSPRIAERMATMAQEKTPAQAKAYQEQVLQTERKRKDPYWYLLGLTWLRLHRIRLCQEAFARVLQKLLPWAYADRTIIHPYDAPFHYAVASMLRDRKQYDLALLAYEECVQLQPDNSQLKPLNCVAPCDLSLHHTDGTPHPSLKHQPPDPPSHIQRRQDDDLGGTSAMAEETSLDMGGFYEEDEQQVAPPPPPGMNRPQQAYSAAPAGFYDPTQQQGQQPTQAPHELWYGCACILLPAWPLLLTRLFSPACVSRVAANAAAPRGGAYMAPHQQSGQSNYMQPGSYAQAAAPAPQPQPAGPGNNAAAPFGGFGQFPGGDFMTGAVGHMAQQHFSTVSNQMAGYVNVGQLSYYFKDWDRVGKEGKYATAREDVNAPDLYIPSMAFVTYMLVLGLVLGAQERFTPEAFGVVASSTFGWLLFELLLYRGASYIMSLSDLSSYELLAYSSYKYLHICLAIVFYLLLRIDIVLYGMASYMAAAVAFFT